LSSAPCVSKLKAPANRATLISIPAADKVRIWLYVALFTTREATATDRVMGRRWRVATADPGLRCG
jgi:hypothetical protein